MNTYPEGCTLVSVTDQPLRVERYRLENGLTLLYHPDPDVQLVSYQTWVPVGSAHEEVGRTGIAHLFEHMMFKATHTHEEGALDRLLEEVGGSANAATWLDWTYYYEDVPSAHLERVISLEADRLERLLLNSEQLEAERKVVMNERRECVDDDPDALMDERLWSLAFGEHPYAHPTIGWMEDIERLSLEDCEAFYRTHYAPNRVVVVVSGGVERSRLLELMVKAYGPLKAQPSPSEPALTLSQPTGPIMERLELTLHAPRVSVGFVAPPISAPESLALECLDELLNQGDSARLHRALVLEREWATGVYSSTPIFKGPGLYELTLELLPDAPAEEALACCLEQLRLIAEEGLCEGELEKAKRQKELGAYRGLQTHQQRAHALGFWEVVVGAAEQGLSRPEALQAVTEESVRAIARTLLEPSRRFVVFGVPSA